MSDTRRPPMFAAKFIRLLSRSAAAQELGPNVCWLLTVIVGQEDAPSVRYGRPVTYYFDQLMPLCGFRSPKQLRAAITTAVEAGWLEYAPGAKARPGRFRVRVPDDLLDMESRGCDESGDRKFDSDSEVNGTNSSECTSDTETHLEGKQGCTSDSEMEMEGETECTSESEVEREGKRKRIGHQCGNAKVTLSNPVPGPIPEEKKDAASGGSSSAKGGDPYSEDFERFWVVYPRGRRQGKQDAWKAWKQAIRRTSPSRIIRAAEQYAGSPVGQGDYVKSPAAWLNQGCWDDDRVAWGLQRDSGSAVSPPRAKAMRTPAQIAALDAEVAVG